MKEIDSNVCFSVSFIYFLFLLHFHSYPLRALLQCLTEKPARRMLEGAWKGETARRTKGELHSNHSLFTFLFHILPSFSLSLGHVEPLAKRQKLEKMIK